MTFFAVGRRHLPPFDLAALAHKANSTDDRLKGGRYEPSANLNGKSAGRMPDATAQKQLAAILVLEVLDGLGGEVGVILVEGRF